MGTCVAYACKNRASRKIPGITFHRFPREEQLRKRWILAVRRENFHPTNGSRLCSEHFSEDQMDRTSAFVVRLRENAVPNIFKGFPQHLQKKRTVEGVHKKASIPCDSDRITIPSLSDVDESLKSQNGSLVSHPAVKNQATENVPAIKVAASSEQELVLGVFEQMKRSAMLPPEGNNVSFVLLEQDSTVISSSNEALSAKLKAYEEKFESYKKKIKTLHQTNRRQSKRIMKLKNYIKKLKSTQSTDEDVSEDDISEEEIYAELLKHQEEVDNN